MPLHVLRWSLALVLRAGAAGLLVSLAHAGRPGGLAMLGAAELGYDIAAITASPLARAVFVSRA